MLTQGAMALGVVLEPAALAQCRRYAEELSRWNRRINLTGLKSPQEIIIHLFLDSLALIPFLGDAPTLADLGSGAGFPGLVLKLARPRLALTLVESRGKKAAFLEYLASVLHLTEVEVLQVHLTPQLARAWGPRFAAVTSRAAFSLGRFLKLAAPMLTPGGVALAPKGPEIPPQELAAARQHLNLLGLEELELKEYQLPPGGEPRCVVLARKKGDIGAG